MAEALGCAAGRADNPAGAEEEQALAATVEIVAEQQPAVEAAAEPAPAREEPAAAPTPQQPRITVEVASPLAVASPAAAAEQPATGSEEPEPKLAAELAAAVATAEAPPEQEEDGLCRVCNQEAGKKVLLLISCRSACLQCAL